MRRPLVAIIVVGQGIRPLAMPDPKACDFRGYAGSVAVDASGTVAAASSPRGSVVGFWSIPDGICLGGLALADACGLAAGGKSARVLGKFGPGSCGRDFGAGRSRTVVGAALAHRCPIRQSLSCTSGIASADARGRPKGQRRSIPVRFTRRPGGTARPERVHFASEYWSQ